MPDDLLDGLGWSPEPPCSAAEQEAIDKAVAASRAGDRVTNHTNGSNA